MEKIFLGKINDEVIYIEKVMGFECGHYFSKPHLCNGSFYGKDIKELRNLKETSISNEQIELLISLTNKLDNLGYGIERDSDLYMLGIELTQQTNDLIDSFVNPKQNKIFLKLIKKEKKYIKEKFRLNDEQIEILFNCYHLEEIKDRSIIKNVYENYYELGKEIADLEGIPSDNFISNYINYEKLGEEISYDDDGYINLGNECVVDVSW